jgi:hypothetical protein
MSAAMRAIALAAVALAFPGAATTQEIGIGLDFKPGIPFRIGVSCGFEDAFGFVVPKEKTAIAAKAGYEFDIQEWYGRGWRAAPLAADSPYANEAALHGIYAGIDVEQALLSGRGYFDYEVKLDLVSAAKLTFPCSPSAKSLFEAQAINGDDEALHASQSAAVSLACVDDPFWSTAGVRLSASAALEAGLDETDATWSFLSSRQELDAWVPAIGRYLFFHGKLSGEQIIDRISGAPPFFSYPEIDSTEVRGIDHSMADAFAVYGNLEIISRFLSFDAFAPMSLGIGVFADAGAVAERIDALEPESLQVSYGSFIEYKAEFYLFSLTVQAGVAVRARGYPEGGAVAVPGFTLKIF